MRSHGYFWREVPRELESRYDPVKQSVGVRVPRFAWRRVIFLNGDQLMKRKNEIPDSSKKKKGPQPSSVPDPTKLQPPAAPPAPTVRAGKPPATSMKSGRRGS